MKLCLLAALVLVCSAGCARNDLALQPPFHPAIGIPEFQQWCLDALHRPEAAPAYRQFSLAYKGDSAAVCEYFAEAQHKSESSEIDAGGGEFLAWTLETLLHRLGDHQFASLLAMESARTQSAVGNFMSSQMVAEYPRTHWLLAAAPNIDFPLNKAYGN